MAKYYGKIGFAVSKETAPSVWTSEIEERTYRGDVLKRNFNWTPGEKIIDDLTIANQYSIVADSFLLNNVKKMKYITINGIKWSITSIEQNERRLILSVGGLYNED